MDTMKVVDASPWPLIEEFRRSLRGSYGRRLKGMVIFGSLARGEWTPESDIDVLVLLDSALDARAEREHIWRLAWSLADRHGALIEPLVFTEQAYQQGKAPLFFNVRREGWFIMPDDQSSAVAELLKNSKQALVEARLLLEQRLPNGATSRAYYAMFNAAQAALLSRGITMSRHKGVISAFGYYFVRPGLISQSLHDALERAYQKRLTADYAPESVTQEEAAEVVGDAEAFLRAVESLMADKQA